MSKPVYKGDRWPNSCQHLLLHAALLDKDRALAAWHIWKNAVDINRLDPASFRLIPLLFSNLSRMGVDDPLLPRLKGVFRMSWYKNKMMFIQAGLLLGFLHRHGIPTMLLKGAVLQFFYYREQGSRPMDDIDILIPNERALSVIDLLQRSEWQTVPGWEPSWMKIKHGWNLRNKLGYTVDLHWNLLSESIGPQIDLPFWESAESLSFNGIPTKVLNASDQLFHACVHGIIPIYAIASIRWIADAMQILSLSGSKIDWRRIFELAEKRNMKQHLRDTLGYLKSDFAAPVPAWILNDLADFSPGLVEFTLYRIKTSLKLQLVTGPYLMWLARFIHIRKTQKPGFIPLSLSDFFRICLGLNSIWCIFPDFLKRIVNSFKKLLFRI